MTSLSRAPCWLPREPSYSIGNASNARHTVNTYPNCTPLCLNEASLSEYWRERQRWHEQHYINRQSLHYSPYETGKDTFRGYSSNGRWALYEQSLRWDPESGMPRPMGWEPNPQWRRVVTTRYVRVVSLSATDDITALYVSDHHRYANRVWAANQRQRVNDVTYLRSQDEYRRAPFSMAMMGMGMMMGYGGAFGNAAIPSPMPPSPPTTVVAPQHDPCEIEIEGVVETNGLEQRTSIIGYQRMQWYQSLSHGGNTDSLTDEVKTKITATRNDPLRVLLSFPSSASSSSTPDATPPSFNDECNSVLELCRDGIYEQIMLPSRDHDRHEWQRILMHGIGIAEFRDLITIIFDYFDD